MKNINHRNEYVMAVITKIFMVVIGLAESILLARYLGAELRGEVSYINSIAQTLFLVATLGIYTAYPYYRKKMDKEELLNTIMSLTLIMFIIYEILSLIIAYFVKTNPEWLYISLITPLLFYDKVVSFIWMIEEPNKRNMISLIVNVIKLIYYFVLFLFGPKTLLWGVTTLIIAPLIESIYFSKNLKFSFSINRLKSRKIFSLISYGFLPMIAVLLTTLNYRIDVIMLKNANSIELASIGVYSIGIMLAEKILLVSDAVKEILLSKLAKGKNEDEVAKAMRFCFIVTFLMAILISIISKVFINILYGDEYSGAEVVTNISIWGTVFMVFFKMISQYNVANKKQVFNVLFLGIAIVLNIAMNAIFIPKYGINGAAIATTIGYTFSSILFIIYFHIISGISYRNLVLINKHDISVVLDKIKKKLRHCN